jgi:Phosphodiesterase/alkaline phosphatase D
MPMINRRAFLEMAAAMGATAVWSNTFASGSRVQWQERRDLFPEGVASGDPESHSVLLWTRSPQPARILRCALPSKSRKTIRSVMSLRPLSRQSLRSPIGLVASWLAACSPAAFTGIALPLPKVLAAALAEPSRRQPWTMQAGTLCVRELPERNQGAQNAYRRMIFEDRRAPETERLAFDCIWATSSMRSSGIRKIVPKACMIGASGISCATRTARKSATFTFLPLSRTIAPFIELISATRIFRTHARAGPSSICGTITNSAGSAGNLCRNLKGRRGPRRPAKWPPIRRFLNTSRRACRSRAVLTWSASMARRLLTRRSATSTRAVSARNWTILPRSTAWRAIELCAGAATSNSS